jgi:choline dehydrogenase-like flavoprotein
MIRAIETLGGAAPPRYDVLIVGTGPAGTTLAAELAGSGLRIGVLESGGERPSPRADRLRDLDCEGIAIKPWSRERVIGGASTTWAGLSSPLDPIDFTTRPFLALPGWPLAREELAPHWEAAAERYRFPPGSAFSAAGFATLKSAGDLVPSFSGLDEKIFLACAEPQDFGREHRAVFEREAVDLWLGATVTALARDERGGIAAVRVAAGDRGAQRIEFHARAFVLATGGIENARLLLVSRAPDRDHALGDEHGMVGRGLMNHPKNYCGVVRLREPVRSLPYYFGCLWRGFAGYAGLRLDEDEQRRQGVLNSYVRFEPLFPWTDERGIEALVTIVKRSRFVLDRMRARARSGGQVVELRDYSETGDDSEMQNRRKDAFDWLALAGTVVWRSPFVARYVWSRLLERKGPRIHAARLRNFMEMEPDRENRVMLAARTDEHGVPLPLVRHRVTRRDRESLVALHRRLALELPRAGVGVLESPLAESDPFPIDQDASHHMGTTRMGDDPRTSVVDRDLRLHTEPNVFLAGASVFPISGCANPTFTIVALSIRLAAHLARTLRDRETIAPEATR